MPQSHAPTRPRRTDSRETLTLPQCPDLIRLFRGRPRLLGANTVPLGSQLPLWQRPTGAYRIPWVVSHFNIHITLRLPVRIPGSLLTPTFQFIINHPSVFAIIVVNYR